MPQVIVVRLTPLKPTSGADFTSYLTTLSIKAFDLSFGDSAGGILIGEAVGTWTPNTGPGAAGPGAAGPAFTPATQRIMQHFTPYTISLPSPAPPDVDIRLEAVATAIIALTVPGAEFDKSDLRLEIRQGATLVAYDRLDFNVITLPDAPLSNNPMVYMGAEPALVVALRNPAAGPGTVELPADGSAPRFVPLRDAINSVLAQDPGAGASLANRSPLTVAQARHIAREIIWNRSIAAPPERPHNRPLEQMYTRPETVPGWTDDARDKADMDRKQYEASLLGYYAVQDANADRLAQYVFSVSAAIWAEQHSSTPARIGLPFPIEAGTPPPPGATFRQADVVLESSGPFPLDFSVPAPYFYALAAVLASSIAAQERYRMATDDEQSHLTSSIRAAIDAGTIGAAAITPENVARRLEALGRGRLLRPSLCVMNADVGALTAAWLAHMAPSIDSFWQQAPFPPALAPGHLDLVLAAVTQQTVITGLPAAIESIPVASTAQLKALSVQDWTSFFLPTRIGLLPEFTNPGTPQERVEAFIRRLRKFFDVLSVAPVPLPGAIAGPPTIPVTGDALSAFLLALPGFTLPVANWNDPAIAGALAATLPADAAARCCALLRRMRPGASAGHGRILFLA